VAFTRKRLVVASAAYAALAVMILLSVFIRSPRLVLTDFRTGEILWLASVREGTWILITYTHSVNLTPVTEIFYVRGEEIILHAVEFSSFGAGMPAYPEDGQTMLTLPDGTVRIEGLDRVMNFMVSMVALATGHTIAVGSREIQLGNIAPPGTPVRFEIIRMNFWQSLLL